MNGRKDVVQLLIDQGANAEHADEYGMTALDLAKKYDTPERPEFQEIVALLVRGAKKGGMKTRKQYKKMHQKTKTHRRNKTMRQKKYRYSITPNPRKGKRKQ